MGTVTPLPHYILFLAKTSQHPTPVQSQALTHLIFLLQPVRRRVGNEMLSIEGSSEHVKDLLDIRVLRDFWMETGRSFFGAGDRKGWERCNLEILQALFMHSAATCRNSDERASEWRF